MEELKQQLQVLVEKEAKTKEERKLIHELSMQIHELKLQSKAEWKQNQLLALQAKEG